ncbi:MAG TPA: adenylate/guanylate cyclase domain-containing protein [Fimbriimonadaceae bacterium]|nr:adenylate/guanylate cyclase domain-containing protein [Fimbriimonadaceae bacterium]
MSFYARLSWQTSVILASTMLIVFAYTWIRAKSIFGEVSQKAIAQGADQVSFRINSLLDTTERQAMLVANLASPSASFKSPPLDNRRFQDLIVQFLPVMTLNQEFSGLTLVLDKTGEYVNITRQPNGDVYISAVTQSRGEWKSWSSFQYGSKIDEGTVKDVAQPKLREADYYRAAAKSGELTWTHARMVSEQGEQDAPAVTCAVPIYDRDHRLAGVASIDLTLTSLSRYVQLIKFGTLGYAFLVEIGDGVEPKIIAYPDTGRLLVNRDGKLTLATVEQVGDDAATTLIKTIEKQGLDTGSTAQQISIKVNDQDYFGGFRRVDETAGRPQWVLGIVVPSEYFMGDLSGDRTVLVIFALVALLSGIYVSLLFGHRVAAPVQGIVAETLRIRKMDFEPRDPPPTNIIDLEELGGAMEQLKTSLRSFEKLVPAQYARHLLSTGQEAKLGGERRHITIYFADIVGFTRLSEMMPPEELVEVLSEYLDVLSGMVIYHEGTVDKFNGDDVMAFWGAPSEVDNPALLACTAAVRSQQAISALHEEWRKHGKPVLKASFGISTGDVVVGNVGSRERMNYTVIGDAVNLASRLQGLNKFYETELLIGETTVEEAGDAVVTRLVDYVAVSGRERPARVYELLGLADETPDDDVKIASMHNHAMDLYRSRSFLEASDIFRTIIAMRDDDGPARILLKRCQEYLKSPPDEDWDGSYRVAAK